MPSSRHHKIGPHWVVVLTGAGQPAAEVERLFECARMLVPDERLVAVVPSDGPLRTTPGPPLVVEAPGDAACLLLATAYVLARDPGATLLFLPCGLEAAHAEPHLLRHLVASSLYARRFPDDIILLGEAGRGRAGDEGDDALWLEVQGRAASPLPQPLLTAGPGKAANGNGAQVDGRRTPRAMRLLTTGCFSVWGPTLWQVARRCLPDLADRCDELRLVLRAIGDGRMARVEEERVLSRLGEVGESRSRFLATVLAKAPESARVLALQAGGAS